MSRSKSPLWTFQFTFPLLAMMSAERWNNKATNRGILDHWIARQKTAAWSITGLLSNFEWSQIKVLRVACKTLYNFHHYFSVFNSYYSPLRSLYSSGLGLGHHGHFCFRAFVLIVSSACHVPEVTMWCSFMFPGSIQQWYHWLITSFNSLSALGTAQLFLYLCFLFSVYHHLT